LRLGGVARSHGFVQADFGFGNARELILFGASQSFDFCMKQLFFARGFERGGFGRFAHYFDFGQPLRVFTSALLEFGFNSATLCFSGVALCFLFGVSLSDFNFATSPFELFFRSAKLFFLFAKHIVHYRGGGDASRRGPALK
jgi:hypothetical protein